MSPDAAASDNSMRGGAKARPHSPASAGGGQDPLSVTLGDAQPSDPVDVRSLVLEVSDELGIMLGDEPPRPPAPAEPGGEPIPPMLADPELADIVYRVMQLRRSMTPKKTTGEAPVAEAPAAEAPAAEAPAAEAPAAEAPAAEAPAAEAPAAEAPAAEAPAAEAPADLQVDASLDVRLDERADAAAPAPQDGGLDAAMDSETFLRHRDELFHPPAKKTDRRLWIIAAAVTLVLLLLFAYTAWRSGSLNGLLPDGWKSHPQLPGIVVPIHRFVSIS